MSKNVKRQRRSTKPAESPSASPFTYELIAKPEAGKRGAKVSTVVTLSIPSPEEECPLTLEPIAQSKLDFLSDTPFVSDRPLHSKLTLPCGHSFHALTLVYSWCKNDMLCPFCRAGHKGKADPACLPIHFKAQLAERVRTVLEEERRADDDDAENAIQFLFGVSVPFSTLVEGGHLTMLITLLEAPTHNRPVFSLSSPLFMRGRAVAPRADLRALSNFDPMFLQISIVLRLPEFGNLTIDSSQVLHLRPEAGRLETTIIHLASVQRSTQLSEGIVYSHPDSSLTCFEVFLTQRSGQSTVSLNNVIWNPASESLDIMAGNEGIQRLF